MALLRRRGEMLLALLVMASGLVVAGVTAPSAAADAHRVVAPSGAPTSAPFGAAVP